jgi:FtsZ-interacting cell division protein ZipA
MDQFRLILLLIGIVLLMLVYFLTRRSSSRQKNQLESPVTTQTIAGTKQRIPMSGDVAPPERPYQTAMAPTDKSQRKSRKRYVKFLGASDTGRSSSLAYSQFEQQLEPLTVVVYIMPLAGISLRREQVVRCLESMGCVPRTDVGFDYVILDKSENKKMHPLFTITDAHTPGIFSEEPGAPDKTNGLVFEMRLPGPIDSVVAFEKLLDIARLVATKLNGVVCDDLQNKLTKQTTSHMKDKILDHSRRLRFTQSSSLQ